MDGDGKNILVVRESGGWGDVLCTLFAVRGLRLKFPAAHISYYAMPPLDAFLRNVPDIDRVLSFGRDDAHPPRRVRVRRRHMGEEFVPPDHGLQGEFHYDQVVDCWCPADVHERETCGAIRRSRIEIFSDAAGVESPLVPQLEISGAERAQALAVWRELAPGRPRVLIQLRAAKVTKSWPLGHIEALGEILRAEGAGVLSIKVEGPDAPGIPSIMGLSHWRIAALAATSDCVVAPDSALFHLAGFVGRPVVALFGPSSAFQYPRHYPLARFIQGIAPARECRCPCLYYEANGFPGRCREEGECMAEISPAAVAEKVLAAVYATKEVAVE